MGKWTEQTIHKRSTTDQYIHKEMLNILGHEENANQNDTEVSPHSSQNGYHQEHNKCWRGCGEREPLSTVGGNVN
jgi:hypothetical protein